MITDEKRLAIVDDCLAKLAEHFDHVQVLATWDEDGLTRDLFRGSGNFYARLGTAHVFIARDIAQENAQKIAESINPEEGE